MREPGAVLRALAFAIVAECIILAIGGTASCQGPRPPQLTPPGATPNTIPATPLPTFGIPVFTPAPEPPLALEPTPEPVETISDAVILPPAAAQAAAVAPVAPIAHSSPGSASVEAIVRLCGADAPLSLLAELMIVAAAERGLDWRLIPAVALAESGCGAKACGGNAWGLGACRGRNAETFEQGIEEAADALAGWVGRVGLEEALCVWESGRPCASAGGWYRDRVLGFMDRMGR